jgi:hypothetical protein
VEHYTLAAVVGVDMVLSIVLVAGDSGNILLHMENY